MSTTRVWQEYERGIDYKTRIGLYQTVDVNFMKNDINVIVK